MEGRYPAQAGRSGIVKLIWTGPARIDRKEIREHVARDNPAAALALDELFSEKASALTAHPGLGRPGRIAGTREMVAHSSYILVYEVTADIVRILAVVHAARRWPPVAP